MSPRSFQFYFWNNHVGVFIYEIPSECLGFAVSYCSVNTRKLLIKSELGWGRVGKKSTQTWKNEAEEFKFERVVWEQSIQNYWLWFANTLNTALFKGHFEHINLHILAYAKTWKNCYGTDCPVKTKNWKGYSILV